MNDLFLALYRQFKRYATPGSANALTGGRLYRTQAPAGAARPYVVVKLLGGDIDWIFGDNTRIERTQLEINVYQDATAGPENAGKIWQGLVDCFANQSLTFADGTHLVTRRRNLPKETVEDGVVRISGEWFVERQF